MRIKVLDLNRFKLTRQLVSAIKEEHGDAYKAHGHRGPDQHACQLQHGETTNIKT